MMTIQQLSLSLSKKETKLIVLPDQQPFLLLVCPAGLYFTSRSDVAVSGEKKSLQQASRSPDAKNKCD